MPLRRRHVRTRQDCLRAAGWRHAARHPADRHGRLLRLGGAGPPPRTAWAAGHRRWQRREPRRRQHRLLRGACLRRAHGDAHGSGPAALPAGRLPPRRHGRLQGGPAAAACDLRALHRPGRAGLDRRGLPRRHRQPAPLRLAAGDRWPDPAADERGARPLLLDRHRTHEAARQAGRRARQARRPHDPHPRRRARPPARPCPSAPSPASGR